MLHALSFLPQGSKQQTNPKQSEQSLHWKVRPTTVNSYCLRGQYTARSEQSPFRHAQRLSFIYRVTHSCQECGTHICNCARARTRDVSHACENSSRPVVWRACVFDQTKQAVFTHPTRGTALAVFSSTSLAYSTNSQAECSNIYVRFSADKH